MKRATLLTACMVAWLVFAQAASPARAQSGGGYDLTWNVLAGGGDASNWGGYTLQGTIGQPAAVTLSGGLYSLHSGFWVIGKPHPIYLPMITRG